LICHDSSKIYIGVKTELLPIKMNKRLTRETALWIWDRARRLWSPQSPPFSPATHHLAAMVSTATRARLSPPLPAACRSRKRERSPLAPGCAASWRASAVNTAPRDDDGRCGERVPSHVWHRFRVPQSALPCSRHWVSSDEASTSSSEGINLAY
jgi:hypothetical protein